MFENHERIFLSHPHPFLFLSSPQTLIRGLNSALYHLLKVFFISNLIQYPINHPSGVQYLFIIGTVRLNSQEPPLRAVRAYGAFIIHTSGRESPEPICVCRTRLVCVRRVPETSCTMYVSVPRVQQGNDLWRGDSRGLTWFKSVCLTPVWLQREKMTRPAHSQKRWVAFWMRITLRYTNSTPSVKSPAKSPACYESRFCFSGNLDMINSSSSFHHRLKD